MTDAIVPRRGGSRAEKGAGGAPPPPPPLEMTYNLYSTKKICGLLTLVTPFLSGAPHSKKISRIRLYHGWVLLLGI